MIGSASTATRLQRAALVAVRHFPAFSNGIGALVRSALPFVVFLMPLLVWPGADRPFSSPKLALWSVATFACLFFVLAARQATEAGAPLRATVALASLGICVSLSAVLGSSTDFASLLLTLTAIGWFELLRLAKLDDRQLAAALLAAGAIVALLACLQFLGADPFAAFGWTRIGGAAARMRVFSTLGNPNYVAAFLAGTFPLVLILAADKTRARRLMIPAALLWGAALLATGSKAGALGALAGSLALLLMSPVERKWKWAALAFACAALALALSPSRSIAETVEGRLFVWRVSLPHVTSIPLLGYGPGAFESQFAGWQAIYLGDSRHFQDLRFAARFDHAHNDALEWLVTYGWAGAVALGSCLGLFIFSAARNRQASPIVRGALAGTVAIGVMAMVDFPLHRPAELFLAVTLMVLSVAVRGGKSTLEKEHLV